VIDPNREQRFLGDWLADRDEPCPVCGYNLRACTAPQCPECGGALKLAVSMEDPSPGGWLLAVIACALAAGFDLIASLIYLVMMLWIAIVQGPLPASAVPMVMLMLASVLVPGVLCAIGLVLLLRKRKRWRTAPPVVRWKRGVAVLLAVFIPHALIGASWLSILLAQ